MFRVAAAHFPMLHPLFEFARELPVCRGFTLVPTLKAWLSLVLTWNHSARSKLCCMLCSEEQHPFHMAPTGLENIKKNIWIPFKHIYSRKAQPHSRGPESLDSIYLASKYRPDLLVTVPHGRSRLAVAGDTSMLQNIIAPLCV